MHTQKTLLLGFALATITLAACEDTRTKSDNNRQEADMASPDMELDQAEPADTDDGDASDGEADTTDTADIEPDAAPEPDMEEGGDLDPEDLQDMAEIDPPVITEVSLSPNDARLLRGAQIELWAFVEENHGRESDYTFRWTQTVGGALDFTESTSYRLDATLPQDQEVVGNIEFEVVAIDGPRESEPYQVRFTVENFQPRAVPQAPSHVHPGQSVVLSGAGSVDLDGDPLTYRWTQRAGTPVTLSDPSAQQPTFVAPDGLGELSFELVVNDGLEDSEVASIVITVSDYSGQNAVFDSHPFRRRSLEEFNFALLAWRGQTLIGATTAQTLVTVDFSNPTNPTVLGELEGIGEPRSLVLLGDHVFVRSSEGIIAVDLSDLSQPTRLGQFSFDIGYPRTDMVGHGDLLVTTTEPGDLLLFDVSDPEEMTLIHTLDPDRYITALAMVEGVIFMGIENTFISLDVSNPRAPVTLQELEISNERRHVLNIVLHEQLAWVSLNTSHAVAIDISDPSDMETVSSLRWHSEGAQVLSATGDHLAVRGFTSAVGIFDVSDLANPRLLHAFNDVEDMYNARLVGDRLVTTWFDSGLLSMRWNQPNPWVNDHLILPRPTNSMLARPGRAVLGWLEIGHHGFYLLDSSNPDALRVVTDHDLIGTETMWPFDLEGDALYTCNITLGQTYAWDISNPEQPEMAWSLPTHQCLWLGARRGQRIYAAHSARGFRILDTSQPLEPMEVGDFASNASISISRSDLEVQGDHLFHVGDGFGLEIYNLEDPTPVRVASLATPTGAAFAIALDGDRAYMTVDTEVWTLDIEQPEAPRVQGRVPLKGQRRDDLDGRHLALVDDIAVVDLEFSGLTLIDIASDNRPRVLGKVDTLAASDTDRRHELVALPGRRVLLRNASTVVTSMSLPTTQGSFTGDTPLVAGPEQTLTATFTGFDPQYELACAVSGGSCRVLSVDSGNQRATIEWTLPEVLGDYELAIAHGNEHFWIIDDRVRLTVQP